MDLVMAQVFTAAIRRSGDWWIGWIEEIPGVNCQESTKEELLESLRGALAEVLEMNRHEARNAAGEDFEEYPISV